MSISKVRLQVYCDHVVLLSFLINRIIEQNNKIPFIVAHICILTRSHQCKFMYNTGSLNIQDVMV